VIVEALWPKRRILETYLNVAQFGRCTFGVGAAAQSIFGIPVDRLGRTQSALLAAVLPNPRKMSAGSPSPYVRSRADDILVQMAHLEGSEFVRDFKESSSAAR
jgi:monofunctional biosynthetic peptidoglycan transglycosylase